MTKSVGLHGLPSPLGGSFGQGYDVALRQELTHTRQLPCIAAACYQFHGRDNANGQAVSLLTIVEEPTGKLQALRRVNQYVRVYQRGLCSRSFQRSRSLRTQAALSFMSSRSAHMPKNGRVVMRPTGRLLLRLFWDTVTARISISSSWSLGNSSGSFGTNAFPSKCARTLNDNSTHLQKYYNIPGNLVTLKEKR